MTKQDQETLVMLISDGKNTYADIHKRLPNLSNMDIVRLLDNWFNSSRKNTFPPLSSTLLMHFANAPAVFMPDYQFKNTDAFQLTEAGKDVLYQTQKEEKAEKHYQETMSLNRRVYFVAIIGALIGAAGLIISLLKG